MMIKRSIVVLLCALLAAPGCATTDTRWTAAPPAADRALLADYLRTLPPGSAVRIDLTGRRVLRATLMKTGPRSLTVQLRTRIPEPPVEVPLDEVLRVAPDGTGGPGVAKIIGIGIAAGAAAALGVFMIIFALLDD